MKIGRCGSGHYQQKGTRGKEEANFKNWNEPRGRWCACALPKRFGNFHIKKLLNPEKASLLDLPFFV
jgi:hypothetical protein